MHYEDRRRFDYPPVSEQLFCFRGRVLGSYRKGQLITNSPRKSHPFISRISISFSLFQNIEEEEEEQHEEVYNEPAVEDVEMEAIDNEVEEYEQFEVLPQTNEDNGSSNYGFDDNLTYEQQSNEVEETNQTDETFIADLADLENANSFPSACDDNSIETAQMVVLDETSNAPSGSNQMDDDFEAVNEQTEETFAQSEETKPGDPDATDLDAENISEDELPGPAKPKVQDAEEVSDEELPGPKLAELPADTEVVSEDELPALKKEGKRKHEDYDPSEPTDEADEKKMKTDGKLQKFTKSS